MGEWMYRSAYASLWKNVGREWSASRPVRFTPGERALRFPLDLLVGLQIGLDDVVRGNSPAPNGPVIGVSSAEVKNAWSYTSTPTFTIMAWCLMDQRDGFASRSPPPPLSAVAHVRLRPVRSGPTRTGPARCAGAV
jgi:hypothetical protein